MNTPNQPQRSEWETVKSDSSLSLDEKLRRMCDSEPQRSVSEYKGMLKGKIEGNPPSEQPQEWRKHIRSAARYLSDPIEQRGLTETEAVIQGVVDAALDAEREERAIIERSREAWKSQVTGLTEALAAERDKAKRLEEALEEARRDEK